MKLKLLVGLDFQGLFSLYVRFFSSVQEKGKLEAVDFSL